MEIDHLINFFRQHQDFDKDIHMLVSNEYTWDLLCPLIQENADLDIHIYCLSRILEKELKKKLYEPLPLATTNCINFEGIETLENRDHVGTLVFDGSVDSSRLVALSRLNPDAVVGLSQGTNVSYLKLWENFCEHSRYFYLRYQLTNTKVEVFDWVKGEHDIELSIIFPVYNVAKYLDQCIQSVTAWKAPYVEYLFVNDGSPDNSREIILQYAKDDSRVKLIDKPNGGCASARQKGLEEAKGRYIGFIDPDDFVEPDMFKQLLGRAMLGSYEMCYCGYNEYYENTNTIKPMADALDDPYAWGTTDLMYIQKLIMYQRVAIWRGIYRRDLIDRAHIEFQVNLRRFDDLPFKVEICANARSVVALKQYLYYYRLDRPGQDVACNDERLYVHFDIFKHLDGVFEKMDNRRLFDYLQVCKVQTHAYALQKIQEKFVDEYARQARDDLSQNVDKRRTVMCLSRWVGGVGKDAYLSIMSGKAMAYKKKYPLS